MVNKVLNVALYVHTMHCADKAERVDQRKVINVTGFTATIFQEIWHPLCVRWGCSFTSPEQLGPLKWLFANAQVCAHHTLSQKR